MVFDITRRRDWPAPFTGRCLRNAHTERWSGREIELLHRVDEVSRDYEAARTSGNYDVAAVIAGEASGLVHDIVRARDVVQRVVQQAGELLAGGARGALAR
jgi:nitronate monooxygenase